MATAHPYFAGKIGEVRGAGGLISLPFRTLNLASDAIAQALPGQVFEGVAEQGSAEFGRTVDEVAPLAIAYAQNPEATKYRIGVNIGTKVLNSFANAAKGDGGAASDIVSNTIQLAAPFASEAALPRLAKVVSEGSQAANIAEGLRISETLADAAAPIGAPKAQVPPPSRSGW